MGAEHHAVLVGERPVRGAAVSRKGVPLSAQVHVLAPDGTLRVGLHGNTGRSRGFELPAAHLHDRRSVRHRDPVRAEADVAFALPVPQLDGFRAVVGDLRCVGRQAGNEDGVREAVAARLYQRRVAIKRRRGHVPGLQKVVEAAIRDDEQPGVPRLNGDGQQKARRLRERQHDGHPGKLRQAPVADFLAQRDFHLRRGLHGDADGRPRLEGEHLGWHGDVQAVHHAPHLEAQILGFGRNGVVCHHFFPGGKRKDSMSIVHASLYASILMLMVWMRYVPLKRGLSVLLTLMECPALMPGT